MAVKLVPRFKRSEIVKALAEKKVRMEQAILLRLQRIGEQFVTNARNNANFKDRTGNLRSSIGYIILKNGQLIDEDFRNVNGGTEGAGKGKQIAVEGAQKFPSGFVLIGVAGMDYAAAVESKGYDVISSSAGIAETALRLAIVKLGDKLK